MIVSSLLPGLNVASTNCLLRKGNKQCLNEVWILCFFFKRPNIFQAQAVAVLHLFLLLGNAQGKTTGHWKITWFVWSYRKKLVLNSDPLRPSSLPGLPSSPTTTGKSLHLTELQPPSCEARVRALFIQALVWLSHTDCKPCGAQTLVLPTYVEQLFFLNNHQMHLVNPQAPKT